MFLGIEPLKSERRACITLLGQNKKADVLCIKTFLCLHTPVRRYKQNYRYVPGGRTPEVRMVGLHHTGRAKQKTSALCVNTFLCLHALVRRY